MKLALIRQRYNPFGGAERFVERALSALDDTSLDVTLLTRRWSGDAGRFKTVRCDPPYWGSTLRDWTFSRAVRQVMSQSHFDIVQAHEKIPGCDIYRAGDGVHLGWLERRARFAGPTTRMWLAANPYNAYTLAAERAMYRHPRLKRVVCISELVKRDVQHYFDLPDDMLPVIYNGIDVAVFNPGGRIHREIVRQQWGIPLDVPLFLFVGSGYERKGLATAIAALPQDAWLLVVGKDKKQARYETLAERHGVAQRVRFVGPQSQVLPFYGAADAFVFPTLYEPFGNVILEAMACGLPVLTTPDCGGAELVQEGENGFVCQTGEIDQFRDRMEQVSVPTVSSEMGVLAAQTAKRFDLPGMTAQMVALYRALLG